MTWNVVDTGSYHGPFAVFAPPRPGFVVCHPLWARDNYQSYVYGDGGCPAMGSGKALEAHSSVDCEMAEAVDGFGQCYTLLSGYRQPESC